MQPRSGPHSATTASPKRRKLTSQFLKYELHTEPSTGLAHPDHLSALRQDVLELDHSLLAPVNENDPPQGRERGPFQREHARNTFRRE